MNTQRQQGSALLLVVVVLLVLSGLGMAMLALTDNDRETVSWDNHVKSALYVAEMGLRAGESGLTAATVASADALLQHVSVAQTPAVTPAVPVFPELQSQYVNANLGTYLVMGAGEAANIAVALPASPTGRPLPDAFYSLYVRNNPNDISVADGNLATSAKEDNDSRVSLIAVAWVARGDRILAVKILEEDFGWSGVNQDASHQKSKDSGGTASAKVG